VLSDNRLSCWGQNNSGALGQPERVQYVPRPQVVAGRKDVAVISAGESVTCMLDRAGAVSCWGHNQDGVLGPNAPEETPWQAVPKATSVPLPEAAVDVVVGTGGQHACAILASHRVACWGDGEYGELGNGGKPRAQRDPVLVGSLTDVVQIAAGLDNTCAIDGDGAVWCWGKDMHAVGAATHEDATTPVRIGVTPP
jgi:alpha-tubulin suppressor-like RCC1 family protein